MQLNAATLILTGSFLLSAALSLYAFSRKSVPAAREFALLMLAVSAWAFCAVIEAASTSEAAKVTWSVLSYIGIQAVPVLFLIFVLRYTGEDSWLTRRNVALLFALPLATLVIAATNGLHGLLWPSVELTETWAGVTAVYAHGPWWWVMIAYAYLLVLAGTIVLVRAVVHYPRLYARQAGLLLGAVLMPWIANSLYAFSPSTVQGIDISTIGFTFSGLLLAFAVFRYQLLDLKPIARSTMFESVRDAMIVVDTAGRVVDINPEGLELAGGGSGDVTGRPVAELFSGWPQLLSFIDSGKEVSTEMELPMPSGTRYFDTRRWRFEDRRGMEMGSLFALRDISSLKRVEEELKGYASTVSHDLKTPLANIMLANDTIRDLLKDVDLGDRAADVEKLSRMINISVRKSADLINDLLRLAEAGQEPAEVSAVDIGEVVARIREDNQLELEKAGVSLVAEDGLGSVVADDTHMHLLFSNLVLNALRHGGASIDIFVERLPDEEPGWHRFVVRDTGVGIPEEDLAQVFTPFFKGATGGTGIGLATVKRIVEVYGGRIEASNDGGARFDVTLHDYPPPAA